MCSLLSRLSVTSVALAALAVGCGDSGSSAPFAGYKVVAANGGALTAAVGDAFRLSVVEGLSDGSAKPLSSDAKVTWSAPALVTALPTGSSPSDSILPQPGPAPTAMWLKNPDHLTDAQLAGVLYLLDGGSGSDASIGVRASVVGGAAAAGDAAATISVAPYPAGDAARGQAMYAANCASCHGAQGEGGTGPGLNGAPDHVAGDPGWTPQMLGLSARSNVDNDGVSLDPSMPKWLVISGADGKPLTTQNFSDMYVFLKTQQTEGPTQAR